MEWPPVKDEKSFSSNLNIEGLQSVNKERVTKIAG